MSGGHNRKFKADPAGYARGKVILLPMHDDNAGFWAKIQPGPFDLIEVPKSGFSGTVLALTHMTLRGKDTSDRTHAIDGIWFPYKENKLDKQPVNASCSPYFVFTSRLGGCALGISDLDKASTTFKHDARGEAAQNDELAGAAVKLMPSTYDPNATSDFDTPGGGMNVTAFFWWNGNKWQLGQSAIYNASSNGQTLVHALDQYPTNMAGVKY